MIQMTDAKVQGFWADSKEIARFLSKLLRHGERIATEWGNRVRVCRKYVFLAEKFGEMNLFCYHCKQI